MNRVAIYVTKAFNLLLNDVERERYGIEGGNLVVFTVGRHDVPQGLADHEFVKTHTVDESRFNNSVSALPGLGGPTGDVVSRADYDALDAQVSQLRDDLSAAQSGKTALQLRVDDLTRQLAASMQAREDQDRTLDDLNGQIRSMTGDIRQDASQVLSGGSTPPQGSADGSTPPQGDGSALQGETGFPPIGSTDPDEADAVKAAGLDVRHKGAGKYAVFKGDEQLSEPMDKAEAEKTALDLATAPKA